MLVVPALMDNVGAWVVEQAAFVMGCRQEVRIRGDRGINPQSEVIGAVVLACSPCCELQGRERLCN